MRQIARVQILKRAVFGRSHLAKPTVDSKSKLLSVISSSISLRTGGLTPIKVFLVASSPVAARFALATGYLRPLLPERKTAE